MTQKQFKYLLDTFTWYREHRLTSGEAFVEALEDYVFVYGDGSPEMRPRGILSASEITNLKEVMPQTK